MGTSKTARPRRRRIAKRVENLPRDPGERRALAIEWATQFLVAAVAQERIALARTKNGELGEWHTEKVIARELALLDSVEDIREKRGPRLRSVSRSVDEGVSRMTEAALRSIDPAFYARAQEDKFVGAYRSLAGWEKLPYDVFDAAARDAFEQTQQQAVRPFRPVYESETKLRAAVAERLNVSEGTVRNLEKTAGVRMRRNTGK